MSFCSPDCPICKGLGFVHYDRPLSHPKFGKLEYCPNINPIKRYGSKCGLTEYELKYSWKLLVDINGMGDVLMKVTRILNQGYGMIFIWGNYGLGKTSILKTIVAESIRSGKESAYSRMVEIMNDLRSAYSTEHSNEEFSRRLNFWMNVPILCIDEFNRIKMTDYVEEQRFTILDQRYENAIQKEGITVMVSNSDPAKLDKYLADRIFDGRLDVIHIEGISARPNMKKGKNEQNNENG